VRYGLTRSCRGVLVLGAVDRLAAAVLCIVPSLLVAL